MKKALRLMVATFGLAISNVSTLHVRLDSRHQVKVRGRRSTSTLILLALFLLASSEGLAQAGWVFASWEATDRTSFVVGTINGLGVRYYGDVVPDTQVGNTGTYNYWTEYGHDLPYTPVTGILPPRSDIICVALTNAHTIVFDHPVVDPVMLVCSLGGGLGGNFDVSCSFDRPVWVLKSGWGYWNEMTATTGFLNQVSATAILGGEGAGVIGFQGVVSSISWTSQPYEYWYGFTIALRPELATPPLRIAHVGLDELLLAWPYPSTGFVLEESTNLEPGSWSESMANATQVGSEWQVVAPVAARRLFYRLRGSQ